MSDLIGGLLEIVMAVFDFVEELKSWRRKRWESKNV
jgi:hypothetical protein